MIGRTVAHYQILDTLGQGGMGVVYKARDQQLDRLVAIKILTPDKVANTERQKRFVQEARAASGLNHPNIVTVYDIGSEDGVEYIVMEFVAGRTLDKVIPHGGMKSVDLLKYAIPIADALSRAHAAGIIHRDLKPGNIMIADDGRVKLLDFGLAKLSDLHDASDAELTHPMSPETQEGSILGTVSYMSPEQAEARRVDARSDIFSFGAVLYEMATGHRAFVGRSKISTLAAVLQSDPTPPAEFHANLPRELTRIIERCLRKDPAWRYQSAADLKITLHDLLKELEAGVVETVRAEPERRRTARWFAILGLGLAIGGLGAWWLAPRGTGRSATVQQSVRPLTTYSGNEYEPALSPNGTQFAFTWNGVNRDNFDVYVRLVDGGAALRLTTDPAPDHSPSWSPDGQRLAFLRNNAIYFVSALGGPERKLLQFTHGSIFLNQAYPGSLSWSPDGRLLAFNGSVDDSPPSIWIASVDSGEYHRGSKPPKGFHSERSPAFSPDGRTLAFVRARDASSRAVILEPVDRDGSVTGPEREITGYGQRIEDLAWQPDGRGLILSVRVGGERSGLFRLTLNGALQALGFDSSIARWPSLSRTGGRMAYEKRRVDANIYRMDGPGPDGGPRPYDQCGVRPVIDSTAQDRAPMISADGRRLAFGSDRGEFDEIHVANIDGSNQTALTAMGKIATGSPRWSPDGTMIAFDRYENGHSSIYLINADGGKPRPITGEGFGDIRPSFSRDGRWVYFASNRSGRLEIWKVASGGGAPQQVTHNSGNEPFESPDGNTLYYLNDSGLWALAAAGGEPKLILPEASLPLYAVAGRSIYYGLRNPPSLWVLRTDTGRKFEYVRFPKATIGLDGGTAFSVSADERTILFTQMDRQESDLVLVENFR